jgi:hypothetical protein
MSVKKILKRIFPVVFLKKTFLFYNRIRIKTIDRILFPEYHLEAHEFQINRQGYPFKENSISIDDIEDKEVRAFMQQWNDWTQDEYLLVFNNPCYIEPTYGWAIVSPNRVVYSSLALSRTPFQRKPDLIKFLFSKKVIEVARAISLRDTGEENYFHFYNDVLAKIFFLKKNNFDFEGTKIVVSKKLWEKTYFQYYLQNNSAIQSLPWLIQDDEYIKCDTAVFCKPLTHNLDIWRSLIAPIAKHGNGRRKVFLTRSKKRLRFIENENEIISVCRKHGLEIVDSDDLTIAQQIDLFSNSMFVAGIHGAGLTNIIFRTTPGTLLEIFPPADLGYLPFHYIMLAKMQHFEYQAIIGEAPKKRFSGGFRLDAVKFDVALTKYSRR